MGSYAPRHLQRERNPLLSKLGRPGIAVAAAAALAAPAIAGMSSADAATVAGTPAPASAPSVITTHVRAATSSARVTVIYYGSRGSLVKTAQRRLGGLAVDGIFGVKTRAAVKRFQHKHHLVVDGVIGTHTWSALGGFPGHGGTTPPSRGGGGHSSSAVVNIAKRYTGIPYVWGGNSPSGFDCSGFVEFVYAKAGIRVPRTASAQQRAAHRVSNPRPGDLVFFGNPAYHDGIYVGNGKMISAHKPGTLTSITKIYAAHTFGRIG